MPTPTCRTWAGILVLAAAIVVPFRSVSAQPEVDVGYARYQGIEVSQYNVNAFYGLRYAASPSLELRWQPPVPIETRNNYSTLVAINATVRGPQCPQSYPPWTNDTASALLAALAVPAESSEDCLLLDVIVPTKLISASLPVILEIHGGGYVQGSSAGFDGSFLTSKSDGSVVFVSIQYRLGALGFLAGSDISSNGSANVGFLDQRLAIEWTRKHISAFGGDPDKITILGGSSGGGSVTAQLQLYGGSSQPPFRAAVADFPWWQSFHDSPTVERQYKSLLETANCTSLSCLRSLSYDKLSTMITRAYKSDFKDGYFGVGDYYYGPSVDGEIIRGLPSDEFDAGRFSRVPLLVDHDALEGLVFVNTSVSTDKQAEDSLKQIWPAATPTFFDQLRSLYTSQSSTDCLVQLGQGVIKATASTVGGPFASLASSLSQSFSLISKPGPVAYLQAAFGDAFVSCSTRTLATSFVRHSVPVWKAVLNSGILIHGAIEEAYFLDAPIVASQPQQDVLQNYILSFVRDLDPNAVTTIQNWGISNSTKPYWPQYGGDGNVLQLNYTGNYVGQDYDNGPRCEFLRSQSEIIRN